MNMQRHLADLAITIGVDPVDPAVETVEIAPGSPAMPAAAVARSDRAKADEGRIGYYWVRPGHDPVLLATSDDQVVLEREGRARMFHRGGGPEERWYCKLLPEERSRLLEVVDNPQDARQARARLLWESGTLSAQAAFLASLDRGAAGPATPADR